ncbi:uncharacterized protein LOC135694146 [Rhopilema esculentum]|uniref:uncharacterized protein LOC135694146 n=1 Tax=Rhopilema esculentum TaxID=499914 RepID=UPI0031D1D0E1
MAAMTLNLLQQMMANGDITVADLASLANTNSQQELYNHEDNAATPGSVDETGFEETETIVSVVTTTPENNLQGLDQYNGEELLAAEFDKEVFLEEVRKYRCLWDIASEGYKIRPMKQNAWSKIGQLFNKDVEFLQRHLKNLKDNLKKCLDKRNRMTRSGAAATLNAELKSGLRELCEKAAICPFGAELDKDNKQNLEQQNWLYI